MRIVSPDCTRKAGDLFQRCHILAGRIPSMPRVRINDGDLLSGAGVEGRRKKKRHEALSSREEPAEEEKPSRHRRGRPAFEEASSADIFYTRRE